MATSEQDMNTLTNKLFNVLSPMLRKEIDAVKLASNAESVDIKSTLNVIIEKLNTIDAILGDKKKTIAVKKEGDASSGSAKTAVKSDDKFPNNKMLYFKKEYYESEEFRKKYITAEIKAKVEQDPEFAKKADKVKAEADYIWKVIIKDNKLEAAKIEEMYKKAKEEHAAKNSVEETLEPVTPNNEMETADDI